MSTRPEPLHLDPAVEWREFDRYYERMMRARYSICGIPAHMLVGGFKVDKAKAAEALADLERAGFCPAGRAAVAKLVEAITGERVGRANTPNVEMGPAKVCHEANRAYCQSVGDDSQVPWSDAPDWQRSSARAGVRFYFEKPRTPAEMHENWKQQKLADGWVYGETKNAVAKTHPCIVPYDKLPEAQKVKNKLFSAIVEALWSTPR